MTRVLLVPDLPIEGWPSMDRYALRLTTHLQIEAQDLEIDVAGPIDGLTHEDGDDVEPRPAASAPLTELRRYLARYWSYPRQVARTPADLVHVLDHSYAHVLSSVRGGPCVVTVHDLLPVITLSRPVKQLRDRVRNRLLHRVLDNLRRYDAWIVATNWLRDELAQWLDRPATQIHVVPYGVDPAYFEPTQNGAAQELREAWKIPPEAFVVLHVGSVGPRKNFGSVVAVVDDLRREGLDARLVQAGGLPSAEHRRDIAKRGLTDVVRWLGPAPESTLRLAYRASNILLFPSHYEGFGLPVLEAMASGLPAVTSGAGGLTEVGGDAAIVVGGREVRPYTEAVCRVAGDAELRQTMSRTGIAWASRFDWSATARQTASVYRELTEQRA